MRTGTGSSRDSAADAAALTAIADTVRGSFQTVEEMTESFIREAIVQGAIGPGERLNQDLIASALGVSRMPVRTSIKQLEKEGLLEVSTYRGAIVSVLSADEIAEIYHLRTLLECDLLDRAVPELPNAVLARLEEIVASLEDSDDLGVRLERRRAFYDTLYEVANRPRTLAMVNRLRDAVGMFLLLQRAGEGAVHTSLLEILRDRDAGRAKRWIAHHLAQVSRTQQEIVTRAPARR